VAAPPETLEALVRNELRGPVSELVRQVVVELVHEQLNGYAPVEAKPASSTNGATPSTKVCRTCGREKPADQFARNRRVCKPCRLTATGRAWGVASVLGFDLAGLAAGFAFSGQPGLVGLPFLSRAEGAAGGQVL
jgi:hypothetical protein